MDLLGKPGPLPVGCESTHSFHQKLTIIRPRPAHALIEGFIKQSVWPSISATKKRWQIPHLRGGQSYPFMDSHELEHLMKHIGKPSVEPLHRLAQFA
jgi:hypothetical protein